VNSFPGERETPPPAPPRIQGGESNSADSPETGEFTKSILDGVALYRVFYERVARPLLFASGTPQKAHERVLAALRWLDDHPWTWPVLESLRPRTLPGQAVEVGGVELPNPLILAAGMVKGRGFDSEINALAAVASGENIIRGWKSLPLLVGAVEFGSFTRWPRPGNPGTVLWRDERTASTQNRVGLKNPGACAAAEFLARHQTDLPKVFGLNIAASPGVTDPEQEKREILETLDAFLSRGISPAWFTLNLSCPNTEDDPGSRQTESAAKQVCHAVVGHLAANGIPLWVKIGPGLSADQYQTLIRVFAEIGVRAVIATNTHGEAASDQPGTVAGVGGGRLRPHALEAARLLSDENERCGYLVDIIGCGGIQDGATYQEYARLGVKAMQYWTALVYRGPLAAAVILNEARGL
jgi:dihydroorotate dehydrogenase